MHWSYLEGDRKGLVGSPVTGNSGAKKIRTASSHEFAGMFLLDVNSNGLQQPIDFTVVVS